jgi:hypothetical protein
MSNSVPTLTALQALNGRIFEALTPEESSVLEFYRMHGRMYGVAIAIVNEVDSNGLLEARSRAEADAIIKRANSRVIVTAEPR